MRVLIYLALLILCVMILGDQILAQPNMTIHGSTFDFGYAPQNAKISHIFWLYSTGTDSLKIEKVTPGCGCTQAPLNKTELAKGDSTALETIFNTGHYIGKQSKRPSIKTNAGPELGYVQFTSNVIANPDSTYPIIIKPYKFDISQFGEKERNGLDFTIQNVTDAEFDLKVVDTRPDMFKVTLAKKIKAGAAEKGRIVVLDEYLKKEFEKSITIELGDKTVSRFTIPVKRTIRIPDANQTAPPAAPNDKH